MGMVGMYARAIRNKKVCCCINVIPSKFIAKLERIRTNTTLCSPRVLNEQMTVHPGIAKAQLKTQVNCHKIGNSQSNPRFPLYIFPPRFTESKAEANKAVFTLVTAVAAASVVANVVFVIFFFVFP